MTARPLHLGIALDSAGAALFDPDRLVELARVAERAGLDFVSLDDGFDPAELQSTTRARIWYSPEVARWEVEKGAIPLVDGAAVSERAVGSPEWLIGEVLSFRGEAMILEPAELRARVAARAKELERELRPAKPAATSS